MREAVKRLTAGILSVCLSGLIPLSTGADDFKTLKFDLGNKGTASGYIGVKAEDKYTEEKGFGFQNPDAVENVDAGGKGALSDAVRFKSSSGHVFNVDIPSGVYKITVVTGDVKSAIITAEERKQLYFLTGTNAKDSFTIPVTDGQLNIYTSSGSGDNYSLSTIEIERAESKPTIWIYGDATVSNRYNVPDSLAQGWGQYLGKHVDTKKYDIRNLAITGFTSVDLAAHESFELSEYYGKTGDILILSLGVNDYLDENISESLYKKTMTGLVNRAKKKGMKVYLVKQHGQHSDMAKYPLPEYKWYGAALEELADSLQVGLIDLYRPFLELDLSNVFYDQKEYYTDDGFHLNALGCDTIAKMVSEQLFPVKKSVEPVKESADDESLTTTIYETEVSGQPISNPHKGYVMTTYAPHYIDSTKGYQYGINGPLKNRAWDCCTIVNGAIKWCELNPGKGKYNWALIDDMLEKCEEYGLTYVIRLVPYSTYNEKDYVPQWIYDEGAKKQTVRRVDKDEDITFPVWDDPVYLQACRDIATALAERYDGDPRVEFVDVSVFGDYGEWHNTFAEGDYMPSLEEQKKMLDHFASVFKKTLLAIPSGGWGEIYQYALSLGITKRDNGLICSPNIEWCLVPTYKANMPVIGENLYPYSMMKDFRPVRRDEYDYVSWSPKRFEETIEISHLSIYAFDQDSHCSYEFYNEHKDLIDKMCNRLGYNYTVTSAKRNGNKLKIKIKNTGLAPSFFNIDLCAEITDAKGNKKGLFGEPVKIKKGTFKDGSEQAFEFEYDGTLKEEEEICLAMYDCDNSLVKGKDPTVRFDNKNNLSNKRLKLVVKAVIEAKKNTPVPTETPENTVAPLPTLPPAEVEETPVLKPEPKITVTQDYDEETTDSAATATVTPAPAPGNAAVVEVDGNKVKVSGDGAEVVEAADKADVTIPSEVSEDGKVYKVTSISDKAFAGNLKITKIHIGDNITRIGDKAFLNCKNLKTVTGGKSVEVIGKAAFKNCISLKKITIGPKVRSIGKDAYRGCKKLKKVIVKTKLLKKKKVGKNAFKGIAKKAVFKIPKKKAKSYKTIFRNVSKGTKIKFQLQK